MLAIRPVVLSGGAGTRLWPLSTPEVPKQFSALVAGESLFSLTLRRLQQVAGAGEPIIVSGRRHLELVESAVDAAPASIIVEPTGRNTAPAVCAAALVADPAEVLLVLPADHLVTDEEGFGRTVATAAEAASDGGIVTFGIDPARPETGFGYIEVGEPSGPVFEVARFLEKPDAETAARLIADGRHLWNSGMFVMRADTALEEMARLCPGILEIVRSSLPDESGRVRALGERFATADAISFDNAVMEKTDRALVVPAGFGWTDLGSYVALLDALPRDGQGNHVEGSVTMTDVTGSFVKATSRNVAIAGVHDVAVVETPEAVLVVALDRAQEVRDLQRRIVEG